jgi:MFS family permease
MTGSFVIALAGFGCAGLVLFMLLRPDPLLTARERVGAGGERPHGSVRRGARVVAGDRTASLGLVTIALGHTVMVAVMVMTPLHMDHGGATLRLIGLVISVHILGMYAFSPLTGMAVDRLGGRVVAVVGSVVLVASCLLASAAPCGMSAVLTVALFGLGLGWSCTLVSGSALLTGAVPVAERAGAQGLADLLMGLGAAGGGALAGVVIEHASYRVLSLGSALLALAVGLAVAVLRSRPPR